MELLHAGRLREALPYLEETAWALPESAPHLFWLARCQASLGLTREAGQTAEALDDFGENRPALHRLKGLIALERGEIDRALLQLDRALAQAETLYDVPTLKAWVLQRKRQWLEALELLQAQAPRHATPLTWHCIAHCSLQAKRPRMAVDAARQFVRSAPREFQARTLLAETLVAAGNREEAWRVLEEARRLKPGAAEVVATGRRLFPERAEALREWSRQAEPAPVRPASEVDAIRLETSRRREVFSRRRGDCPRSAPAFRPPGRHEMERFAAVLESGNGEAIRGNEQSHPRVWEVTSPSRFAGAAIWWKVENEEGAPLAEIRFRLRPGFQASETAVALLRPLFDEVWRAGCRTARIILPDREKWEPVLSPFGLHWASSDEYWKLDGLFSHDKLARTATQWKKRLPSGWSVRPIETTDWEFVKEASGATGFFSTLHLEEIGRIFAPDLSCMVEAPSGPAGVLLATRRGMTGVIEFLGAVDPRVAPFVSQMALVHFLRRDGPNLLDDVIFTTNPGKGESIRRMTRRFEARLLHTYHHFRGEIVVTGPPFHGDRA